MATRAATASRARIAVSALFFINGALIASVLPRLPAIKANLELSNTALGFGIAFGPAGALLASSLAGLLVARFGSGRLAVAASALYGATLSLVGLAPVWAAFAAAVFLYGVCDGLADVSQNAHGLRVQRQYGRSLINGFHAWWSIGGVAGGGTSALAAALGVPLAAHLGVVGGVLALVALFTGPLDTFRSRSRTQRCVGRRAWTQVADSGTRRRGGVDLAGGGGRRHPRLVGCCLPS